MQSAVSPCQSTGTLHSSFPLSLVQTFLLQSEILNVCLRFHPHKLSGSNTASGKGSAKTHGRTSILFASVPGLSGITASHSHVRSAEADEAILTKLPERWTICAGLRRRDDGAGASKHGGRR